MPQGLLLVAREWARIGCIGFGGPPAHIKLFRQLCVERNTWLTADEFEDALSACNLLPGPASTQLAIYCAWRIGGLAAAVVGGVGFIAPGLVAILALSTVFLASTPQEWILGAGAGAGAAVGAVAAHAGVSLIPTSWVRRANSIRWIAYLFAGSITALAFARFVVVALLACGLLEMYATKPRSTTRGQTSGESQLCFVPPIFASGVTAVLSAHTVGKLAWVCLKVGALSYGGGFVIVPLLYNDAVNINQWMTEAQFLNAVALGQITPGPVMLTVATVGYAAAGILGGLFAAVVAFTPSFAFVMLGAPRFDRLRSNHRARAFLAGSGPAAIGAILGSAITLALTLDTAWQYATGVGAAIALFALRRSTIQTMLTAAAIGTLIAITA